MNRLRNIWNRLTKAGKLVRVQRDLAIALGSEGDLAVALGRLLDVAFQIEGIDCGGVYLVDRLTGTMDMVAHRGLPEEYRKRALHYDADSLQARFITAGKPIYGRCSDTVAESKDPASWCECLQAVAIIPVQHEGQVVAALNFGSLIYDEMPVSTRDTLEAVTAQIGGVIARAVAEEALRRSEERYRTLVENIPIGVYRHTPGADGRFLMTNPAFCRMFGFESKDDLKSVRVADLFMDPADNETFSKNLLVQESVKGVELYLKREDGTSLWGAVTAKVMYGPSNGDVVVFDCTIEDITERVQNVHLLRAEREQQELTEALTEAAAAVNSTLDIEQVLDRILEQVERVVTGDASNIMLIDDEVARIVRSRGHRRSGLEASVTSAPIPVAKYASLLGMVQTGKPIVIPDTAADPSWVSIEDREWRRSYVAAPIRVTDHAVGFLNVVSTRSGQFDSDDAQRLETFASHAATAIENARLHQELHNYVESLEQRVEERTAQLATQYARSEAILHSASDGIVVVDRQGKIVQSNPVAQTWLTQTLSSEEAALLRDAVQNLGRRAKERLEAVLELEGLDLELKVAPISESGVEPTAVVVIHDVSHLKVLDRMKTHFVTNISHALRTPVANIKLYANLLRTDHQQEKTAYYVQVLEHQADQLMHLVQDILDVTTLDSGQAGTIREPISLVTVINDVVKRYRNQAQASDLTLVVVPVPPELPTVKGDHVWLFRGLSELVENAVVFTPPGGQVTVEAGTVEEQGVSWVTIAVRDTGPGISAEEQERVFDRFYRGGSAESGHIPGSGLGLSITKDIVWTHGGRVTVESEIGAGSTFTLWLPVGETFLEAPGDTI